MANIESAQIPLDLFNDRALARRTGLAGAIARFEEWMADPDSPVRAIKRQAAKPGIFADFPTALEPALKQALISRGIHQLYSHQAQAFEHVAQGQWSRKYSRP